MKRCLLLFLCGLFLLSACGSDNNSGGPSRAENTTLPTPEEEYLQVSGVSSSSDRLRVILHSLRLLKNEAGESAQLYLFLVDPQGTYTYLLYPANSSGAVGDEFSLTSSPLELSLNDESSQVTLWVLAVHHTRYALAEAYGIEALSTSLALGFREWLTEGDPADDPLAAVVSGSEGALFNWFAEVEVLGQSLLTFNRDEAWNVGTGSLQSKDQGLSAIYAAQHISSDAIAAMPSATPEPIEPNYPGYVLRIDETFEDGLSNYTWYQGQDDTYVNRVVDGAYEIQLTDIRQRQYAQSWGSLENQRFVRYVIQADVSLLDGEAVDGRYGIWFNYQDDYNFIYFGISNRGEYRVAVNQSNSSRREITDWTPSSAIHTGTATNTLTIEAREDNTFTLAINGQRLLTFTDESFSGGSIAFFCYAESVPTTCQLDRLRVWEPES